MSERGTLSVAVSVFGCIEYKAWMTSDLRHSLIVFLSNTQVGPIPLPKILVPQTP